MKWPSLKRKRSGDQRTAPDSDQHHTTDSGAYRAVCVAPELEGGCKVCEQQLEQRYLMSEAPALPLAGCDAAQCRCRYVRYQDRREEVRRDADIGIGERPHLSDERRSGRTDRRSR